MEMFNREAPNNHFSMQKSKLRQLQWIVGLTTAWTHSVENFISFLNTDSSRPTTVTGLYVIMVSGRPYFTMLFAMVKWTLQSLIINGLLWSRFYWKPEVQNCHKTLTSRMLQTAINAAKLLSAQSLVMWLQTGIDHWNFKSGLWAPC